METALLIFIALLAWFWIDSLHARDIAVQAGKHAAEQHGLQFLDESVASTRLWAGRDEDGRMKLQRTYRFEVSDTGADRLSCSLTLLGKRVESLNIPPYRDNVVRLY